jgi:tetratricopeptide (TPR) repeat protein
MNLSGFFKIDNTELAYQLFENQMLGGDVDKKYRYSVNKILKECTPKGDTYPERQQVLLKIIELIGDPTTPKQRFIVAKAYAWSRAGYRDKAIYYLKLYLNNPLYKEAYIHIKFNVDDTPEKSKLHHLSEMYGYLGKAYMGEYDFDNALSVYEYMIGKFPEDPPAYMGKCEALIKKNELTKCYNWLLDCKKLPYYKLNKQYGKTEEENWFHFTINRLLKDVEEKINKGYVYRPRKNKK